MNYLLKWVQKRNFLSSFSCFVSLFFFLHFFFGWEELWEGGEWSNLNWGCANHKCRTVSSRQLLNLHWQIFLLYLAVPFFIFHILAHIHKRSASFTKGKLIVRTGALRHARVCEIHWRNERKISVLLIPRVFQWPIHAYTRTASDETHEDGESTSGCGYAKRKIKLTGITRQFFHFTLKNSSNTRIPSYTHMETICESLMILRQRQQIVRTWRCKK